MGKIILVTGPARSGKSEWAENLALESGKKVVYIATANENPHDLEWPVNFTYTAFLKIKK